MDDVDTSPSDLQAGVVNSMNVLAQQFMAEAEDREDIISKATAAVENEIDERCVSTCVYREWACVCRFCLFLIFPRREGRQRETSLGLFFSLLPPPLEI